MEMISDLLQNIHVYQSIISATVMGLLIHNMDKSRGPWNWFIAPILILIGLFGVNTVIAISELSARWSLPEGWRVIFTLAFWFLFWFTPIFLVIVGLGVSNSPKKEVNPNFPDTYDI